MKVLLTGVTGYIGKRLLPVLLEEGHTVICCVRNKNRLSLPDEKKDKVQIFEVDFLKDDIPELPGKIDAAYYLIHSMSSADGGFEELEKKTAHNFLKLIKGNEVQQIIYLSGIVNEEKLSRHLSSRFNVENILRNSGIPCTVFRAGIIVGSGSASFEIIRDLVEKLPVMVAPRWLKTRSQPIAIRNVLQFLQSALLNKELYDTSYDIGGPSILTYKDMLLQFAEVRELKRQVITVPVMTPRLSSYWLYFVTSTSYRLAINLVDSMKVDVICRPNDLHKKLGIELLTYKEAIKLAFKRIQEDHVPSKWIDAIGKPEFYQKYSEYIEVPEYGCFTDKKSVRIKPGNEQKALQKVWEIGGDNGWYYADFLWKIRGAMDKIAGGVGLRRGRTHKNKLSPGDALDFWRVILADFDHRRLLLYAEMKLPGEAWLEFKIIEKDGKSKLVQTATFRPVGIGGRLYWYSLLPFHLFIFRNMAKRIAKG